MVSSGVQRFTAPRNTMSATESSYPNFFGRVRHALDVKKRTTIPTQWRPITPAPLWIFPQSDGQCLLAMTESEFRAIPDLVNSKTNLSPDARRRFIDVVFAEAEQIIPDKQGRFVIPDHFCQRLKLKDQIIISGANSKLKIWNPETFEKFMAESEPDSLEVGKEAQL